MSWASPQFQTHLVVLSWLPQNISFSAIPFLVAPKTSVNFPGRDRPSCPYLGYKLHWLEVRVLLSVLLCTFTWLKVECLAIPLSSVSSWLPSVLGCHTATDAAVYNALLHCKAHFCHFLLGILWRTSFCFVLFRALDESCCVLFLIRCPQPPRPIPDPWTFGLLCHSDSCSYCGHNSFYIFWDTAFPNA